MKRTPAARNVSTTDDALAVELSDGRSISAPLAWYPRLLHGAAEERGRNPSKPTASASAP